MEEFKEQYLKLQCQYCKVINSSKTDLDHCKTYKTSPSPHKDDQPVYQCQFLLKPKLQQFVKQSLQEWFWLGVVRCSKAAYNSPIFCVPKKGGGGLRIIQDFRGLNSKTHTGKYSMKKVNECNSNIGRANSTIISIIDLTSGFWQMPIAKKGSHLMAFTEQGQGHSRLVTSPMGFLGCPASFQCLMEKALEGIKNIIIYIDDVIIHTATHEHHLKVLVDVLRHLDQHNLKINLAKCLFGNTEVAYLGFVLTLEGIRAGREKLKVLRKMSPPINVHQHHQFFGLFNFFRNQIKNFSLILLPLH